MKTQDIKNLSTADVQTRISEETQHLSKLKLNHAVSPAENPMKIRTTRKGIARLKTELTSRLNSENK